jgi:predicted acylesterase/phospholipase RssA
MLKHFGLALGGGSARAMAHIGALKVLEQRGLKPAAIAGTSSGAFMAAVYALGTPAIEMEKAMRELNMLELWSHAFDFGLHKAALIHGKRFMHWLDRKYFYGATFDDVTIPLAIACMDEERAELVILRHGSIARAVMASSALPLMFAPVEANGRYLIDGGFISTVPFQALQVLGSHHLLGLHAGINAEASMFIKGLRKWYGSSSKAWRDLWLALPAPSPYKRLSRGLIHVLASYQQKLQPPQGATLISMNPPIAWWDFHRSPEAIAAGEVAMKNYLDKFELAESTEPKA